MGFFSVFPLCFGFSFSLHSEPFRAIKTNLIIIFFCYHMFPAQWAMPYVRACWFVLFVICFFFALVHVNIGGFFRIWYLYRFTFSLFSSSSNICYTVIVFGFQQFFFVLNIHRNVVITNMWTYGKIFIIIYVFHGFLQHKKNNTTSHLFIIFSSIVVGTLYKHSKAITNPWYICDLSLSSQKQYRRAYKIVVTTIHFYFSILILHLDRNEIFYYCLVIDR